MLTLLEQFEHTNGTFFSLQPSGSSRNKLQDLIYDMRLVDMNSPDATKAMSFHVTVIYSKTPCSAMRYYEPVLPIWATGFAFDLFGPEHDTLVLRLHSNGLVQLNKDLQVYGPTSDYPEYKPHITLVKNRKLECPVLKEPLPLNFNNHLCTAIEKDK